MGKEKSEVEVGGDLSGSSEQSQLLNLLKRKIAYFNQHKSNKLFESNRVRIEKAMTNDEYYHIEFDDKEDATFLLGFLHGKDLQSFGSLKISNGSADDFTENENKPNTPGDFLSTKKTVYLMTLSQQQYERLRGGLLEGQQNVWDADGISDGEKLDKPADVLRQLEQQISDLVKVTGYGDAGLASYTSQANKHLANFRVWAEQNSSKSTNAIVEYTVTCCQTLLRYYKNPENAGNNLESRKQAIKDEIKDYESKCARTLRLSSVARGLLTLGIAFATSVVAATLMLVLAGSVFGFDTGISLQSLLPSFELMVDVPAITVGALSGISSGVFAYNRFFNNGIRKHVHHVGHSLHDLVSKHLDEPSPAQHGHNRLC